MLYCTHARVGAKMAKNKAIIPALSALIVVIALLHVAAMNYNLYYFLWWFDLLMHFLGGLWCGFFTLFYVMYFDRVRGAHYSRLRIWMAALSVTLVVGIAWEFYEYFFGFTFTSKPSYQIDVILDLIMDTLGAVLAAGSVMIYTSRRSSAV